MKKNAKKLISMLFALAIMACITCLSSVDAKAVDATTTVDTAKGIMYNKAVRIGLSSTYDDITVYLKDAEHYVASVKANKSGLIAKVSGDRKNKYISTVYYGSDNESSFDFQRENEIDLFATRKGTYNLTLTIKDASGKTVTTKTIKIYAGYPTNAVKTMKYGKTTYYPWDGESISTKKASGKLTLKANSGYKIKKIEYATSFDSNGEPVFKRIKSGKTLKLAKKAQKFSKISNTYDYTYSTYTHQYNYDYLNPVTIVKVTYYDKLLKVTESEEYYFFYIK